MKAVSFLVLLVAGLVVTSCSRREFHPAPLVTDDAAVIEIADLEDSRPRFYSLPVEGKRIYFFVVRIGESVQSYFDACQKCYTKGRGYSVEGAGVICKACNVRYPVDELEGGLASCRPIPLPGRRDGGRYLIALRDLAGGCDKFP